MLCVLGAPSSGCIVYAAGYSLKRLSERRPYYADELNDFCMFMIVWAVLYRRSELFRMTVAGE